MLTLAGMTDDLRDVSLADIRAAADRISGHVDRTPMLSSRTAARFIEARTGVRIGAGPAADGVPRLFLKAEHLQVTGSFKPRGATNRVIQLTPSERSRGLIAVSAGNHAMAVAYAARGAGVPVVVVMPNHAAASKVRAAVGYGAEVVLHGEDVGDTFRHKDKLVAEHGYTFVHPFDHPGTIAGTGTVGLEVIEDLPEVDVVVVGVGGGGLISGVAAAVRQLRPLARVVGVEPRTSNALTLGLEAGEPVALRPRSIADGLGAPFAGEWTIDLARRYVDRVALVDEATIAFGVRFALERMKQLLEPAGAAALGAVLGGHVELHDGETVCVIGSGGNVDLDRLPEILALADVAAGG